MEIFFRNQVNITIFVVLAFVCFVAIRKLDRKDQLNRSFIFTVLGVMIGLLAESLTDFLDGNPNGFPIILNNLFSVILFVFAPIISLNFFLFIFRFVFQGKKITRWLWALLIIPVISNIIISILSPFFGLFFRISDTGVYSRGPLWLLSAFSTYVFMIAGSILVLVNFKRMIKHDSWLILGIGIIPVIGGIAQTLVYGIFVMWSSAGIALVIAYLFLQDRMIHLDSLTGAWNRESFFMTYSRRVQLNPDNPFGAIYFDIDNLKMINDTFGHLEGDRAIQIVMKVIREALEDGGIICRLGGDEFIVLIECSDESEIFSLLENIKSAFRNNKEILEKKYHLECSFSAALYTKEFTSINAFLTKLDFLMYEEKFSKKKGSIESK